MKLCSRCVLDEAIPDIVFDEGGICNYCKFHDKLTEDYPRGDQGRIFFEKLVEKIKKQNKKKKYDCIIGMSGGTDSTYLIYLMKKMGLRPLAVNVDNGWHSAIAVKNIKKCLDKLAVDLRTYVIDWEEMKEIHLAFMKASLPWPDGTTDAAIFTGLYRIAAEEGIKHIFIGHDFRTEGRQPTEWSHTDGRMIKHIVKKFSGIKLRTFPNLTIFDLAFYGLLKGIKNIRPYWYLEYNKQHAKSILKEELDWEDYGGHHHESIFTRFNIAYWLPKKFNIDKRKVTLSALVRSGEVKREDALHELDQPPYDPEKMEEDKHYVIDKLGITEDEFEGVMKLPNRRFLDYPSEFTYYQRFKKIALLVSKLIFSSTPMTFYELKKSEKVPKDVHDQ